MGIFSRLAQLIKSNLNDLISKSEDPEKMLNQVVLDMNNQLVEAKKQVAASIADEKRLAKQFEQEMAHAAEWERRAMMALRAGNEELAKEALARKKEHDQLAETFKEQWTKQKNAVDQLKKALRMLNDKIEEAKRKKNVLIARKKRAEAQKAIQETMHGLKDQSAFETFDRMAGKIDQLEAEAEAAGEIAGGVHGRHRSPRSSPSSSDAPAPTTISPRSSARWACSRPRRRPPSAPRRRSASRRPPPPRPAAAAAEQDELAAALEEIESQQEQQAGAGSGRSRRLTLGEPAVDALPNARDA